MAIYYGIDSNYASTLFSSLNTSQNSYSSLTGMLSQYASIRNGSYGSLLQKYYSLDSVSDTDSIKSDKTTSISADTTKDLKKISESVGDLKESANALIKSGSGSVFEKTSKTDENGHTTKEYDKDKIYGAVSDFIKDYNAVIDSTKDTNASSIASNRNAMLRTTDTNESLLSSIGITAEKDGKLSIDETKFKSSDMATVKSLFHGTGSYAYQTSVRASMIEYNTQTELSRANTYTGSGTYSYNYSSGALYDSMF